MSNEQHLWAVNVFVFAFSLHFLGLILVKFLLYIYCGWCGLMSDYLWQSIDNLNDYIWWMWTRPGGLVNSLAVAKPLGGGLAVAHLSTRPGPGSGWVEALASTRNYSYNCLNFLLLLLIVYCCCYCCYCFSCSYSYISISICEENEQKKNLIVELPVLLCIWQ